jgi:acyl dehydratase
VTEDEAADGRVNTGGDGAARVDFDERGPRTRYEDLEIGTSIGTTTWAVTQELVDEICERFDDYHEWYSVRSPFGTTIAPPIACYSPIRHLFSQRFNVRGLLYIFGVQFERPIRVGDELTLTGEISNKWIQKNREFVEYTATAHDRHGELVFTTRRAHALDFITRDRPRAGRGIDSGLVTVPGNQDGSK